MSSTQRRVNLSTQELRSPSRARKVVGVLLNAAALAAAAGGAYFLVETIQSLIHVIGLSRASQPAGPAGPAVAILGVFDVMFIFVFGLMAGICLAFAAWILEPISRWRNWRSRSRARPT